MKVRIYTFYCEKDIVFDVAVLASKEEYSEIKLRKYIETLPIAVQSYKFKGELNIVI